MICTWNRAALLAGCLESLLGQDLAPEHYEILVVDDGSTDDTGRVVQEAARVEGAPPVHHVVQPHLGQPAARNRGLERARGAVVYFVDDDEIAPPGLLQRVVARLAEDPTLDGVGGPYRDRGGGLRTCAECSLADAGRAGADQPGETWRLLGGNMAIRASVFDEVGSFDADLAGRGDDTEWFHRARGHRFELDPDLWIWHRRDQLGAFGLVRHAYRQGLSIPLSFERQGRRYRPAPGRILRSLAHSARRRCARGLWLAARDLGGSVAYLRRRLAGSRTVRR